MSSENKSELDRVIPPEIKNDELYLAIQTIAKNPSVKTILEIGSSSGEGSTKALVSGMKENSSQPRLFCLELSRPRFAQLQKRYQNNSFVRCYNASSVALENFPKEAEIIEFYQNHQTALNNYPLEQVIGWWQQDIAYVKSQEIPSDGIKLIKQENQVDYFDLVLIDGSEFTGVAELNEVYGANFIALDDINTLKNHQNYQRLRADENYTLITENYSLRHGYAIFEKNQPNANLPIHFFTIVLNGEPFIRYHIKVFEQLPYQWHWHIVEGVAELKHDTAWSLRHGGKIPDNCHYQGRSNDGTSAYLDELVQIYPENITVYRQPEGKFWDGKREMINAPLANISEECLLWQVDVDELWTVAQIKTAWQMFVKYPQKRAAFYWCQYFVGDNLVVSTRNCYAQNPDEEWQRTWRFKPGGFWQNHEPPKLVESSPNGGLRSLAEQDIFSHAETEKQGLVFQHFAYVRLENLIFKQDYYGYENAVWEWVNLQEQDNFPLKLRHCFSWVSDDKTMVDRASACGVVPLASRLAGSDRWQFSITENPPLLEQPFPKIIIDGVYFQLFKHEINSAWQSWLSAWQNSSFANHIVLLDRGGTAPKIPGMRRRAMPLYDLKKAGADAKILERVCQEEKADLLISSYYTAPILTPYILMLGDLPEAIDIDFNSVSWKEKYYAVLSAYRLVTVSEDMAGKLRLAFPDILPEMVTIIEGSDCPNLKTANILVESLIQLAEEAKTNQRQNQIFWQDFRQLQGELQQSRSRLAKCQQEIREIQSSKLWQMRSLWSKIKKTIGWKS